MLTMNYLCSLFYSHLMGIFYRTIRMIDNGIKPVYVFDGKPPEMKGGEVSKNRSTYMFILKIAVAILNQSQ